MAHHQHWKPLEKKIYAHLKALDLKEKTLLVGASGGLDSMSLLHVLLRLQKTLKYVLVVGHVHHGQSFDPVTKDFRQDTARFVQRFCVEHGLDFLTNKTHEQASSEEQWRKLRYSYFKTWMKEISATYLVLAHHEDDLLETRLIRLIRGVGAQGIKSMSFLQDSLLRPLLRTPKVEIHHYAEERQITFVDDPSNNNKKFLRNWLRNVWLKELEAYRPGASHRLAQSLELISEELEYLQSEEGSVSSEVPLQREELSQGSLIQQKRHLASYLKSIEAKSYTASQIDEVLKRLKTPKKSFDFQVGGLIWRVSPNSISAIKKASS